MITVDNGLRNRPLSDAEIEAINKSLANEKKARIKAMEAANSMVNAKLTERDFGIDTINELIKLFSGI